MFCPGRTVQKRCSECNGIAEFDFETIWPEMNAPLFELHRPNNKHINVKFIVLY